MEAQAAPTNLDQPARVYRLGVSAKSAKEDNRIKELGIGSCVSTFDNLRGGPR